MIIAETVLTLSWVMLFEIVREHMHQPRQDRQNLGLQLRRCLHCHGWCYSKSFANVAMIHSTTSKIYDYSWGGAYIVMDNATWNRLQKYAWPTLAPSTNIMIIIIAEKVLTLPWTTLFEIVCNYAVPTPGPYKSMIIAETELTLSWTMLFEIVCKCKHDPLQDHRNLWLWLRRCLHCHGWRYLKSFAKVCMMHSTTIKIHGYSWDGADIVMDDAICHRLQTYAWPTARPSRAMIIAETVLTLSWVMLFKVVCERTHPQLHDHDNLWL
jgi:hypothetical protein